MRIALALAVCCAGAALVVGGFSNRVDPVAAAAMKSEDAGGANLALTVSTTAPGGQPVSVTATGVFDGQEADVTADVSSILAAVGAPAGSGQVELRYLQENGDPVVYVNVPALAAELPGGATWVRLDLEQVGKQARGRRQPADRRGDREPCRHPRPASGERPGTVARLGDDRPACRRPTTGR